MANGLQKLLLADFTVLVFVSLLHDVINNSHWKLHSHFLKLFFQLIFANFSIAVFVKIFEDVV